MLTIVVAIFCGSLLASPNKELLRLNGMVDVRHAADASWQSVFSEMAVDDGDWVQTHEASLARINFHDGKQTATIYERTTVHVEDVTPDKISLRQFIGRLQVTIKHFFGKPVPVEVTTPSAVMAVKGSDADCVVLPDGTTYVAFGSGYGTLTANGKTVTLTAGQSAVVHPGSTPGLVGGMLSPASSPTLASSQNTSKSSKASTGNANNNTVSNSTSNPGTFTDASGQAYTPSTNPVVQVNGLSTDVGAPVESSNLVSDNLSYVGGTDSSWGVQSTGSTAINENFSQESFDNQTNASGSSSTRQITLPAFLQTTFQFIEFAGPTPSSFSFGGGGFSNGTLSFSPFINNPQSSDLIVGLIGGSGGAQGNFFGNFTSTSTANMTFIATGSAQGATLDGAVFPSTPLVFGNASFILNVNANLSNAFQNVPMTGVTWNAGYINLGGGGNVITSTSMVSFTLTSAHASPGSNVYGIIPVTTFSGSGYSGSITGLFLNGNGGIQFVGVNNSNAFPVAFSQSASVYGPSSTIHGNVNVNPTTITVQLP